MKIDRPDTNNLTPYERFVAATKAIVSVPKKDVEQAMQTLRRRRKNKKASSQVAK